VDLRRQIGVLRSWARWIAAGTVLAALVAFAIGQILPKEYEADTRLLVGQALVTSTPNVDQFATAQSLAASYGELANSRRVLEPVHASLGSGESLDAFRSRIVIRTQERQPFIDITARGSSPEMAKAIVDGVAGRLLEIASAVVQTEDQVVAFNQEDLAVIRTQILETRTELTGLVAIKSPTPAQQDRIDTVQTRLLNLRSAYAALLSVTPELPSNHLTVIDDGELATRPTAPGPIFTLVLGALLGLIITIAGAFIWETTDDRIRTAEDVERATGLGVIGRILRMPVGKGRKEFYSLASLLYPRSPVAEAFRALRTNLEFASLDERHRMIVVTSSAAHEGKTVIAANLAVAYAQAGRQVILVDADLRLPGVHTIFGLSSAPGLTDLALSEDLTLQDVLQPTEVPGLRILAAGTMPGNPAELLGSLRIKAILATIRGEADHVVIDTAPVGVVTDAALLAADADATIFVVRESFSSERVVRRGREALASVNARIVGVVLNFVRPRAGEAEPYFATYMDDKIPSPDAPPKPAPSGPTVEAPRSLTVTRGERKSGDVTRQARPRSTDRGGDA
jgi:succinoglycan biosynthesis transport protein ExoP